DPAPARPLPPGLAELHPILTPNRGEATTLSGEEEPEAAAIVLRWLTSSPAARRCEMRRAGPSPGRRFRRACPAPRPACPRAGRSPQHWTRRAAGEPDGRTARGSRALP